MAMTNVFTGANGTLTLADALGPEGQDATVIRDLYAIPTVGRVTGVEIYVQTDMEEFYEIGRRHAASLHGGNIHISGKVSRAYVNGALLMLLLGRGAAPDSVAEPYVQPTFVMSVTLNDPAVPTTTARIELGGVKFQNWAYALPEDDFVMENVTFRALTIRVQDTDNGTAQTPEFPEAATT